MRLRKAHFEHVLISVILLFSTLGYAQHEQKCTTDQHELLPRLIYNKERIAKTSVENRSGNPLYAPITFHRVGTSEGDDYVPITSVLDNMCRLGKDFSEYSRLVPYIHHIEELNSNTVNTNPTSSSARSKMRLAYDQNSINVFIPKSANDIDNDNVILGYYDPNEDYVVIRRTDIIDSNSTLGHELGHYFSLLHPFAGWESEPYEVSKHGNPLNVSRHPLSNALIELVNRNANCETAGDLLCDTPASYLFGFGSDASTYVGDCVLAGNIFDSNSDKLVPQAENMMDYFNDCDKFIFTNNQAEVMETDFLSPSRSYIRSNYVPNIAEITEAPDIIYPNTGEFVEGYNSIFFEWTEVSNADNYLVEIQNVFTAVKYEYIVNTNSFWATTLEPDSKYIWFVHPFNETSSCYKSSKKIFDTGSTLTTVEDIQGVQTIELYPNPGKAVDRVTLAMDVDTSLNLDISILSTNGQLVNQVTKNLQTGPNKIKLDIPNTPGVYLINIKHEKGVITKRYIRQ